MNCKQVTIFIPLMRNALFIGLLFVLQCYLILQGAVVTNKLIAPFLIFGVSAIIIVLYFAQLLRPAAMEATVGARKYRLVGMLAGVAGIAVLYPLISKMFKDVADPAGGSDVIPQLVALYTRNAKGLQPYYPLKQFAWHPFPVYMPLHWLPLGIGYLLHIDIRWVGVLFLVVAVGIYGYRIAGGKHLANVVAAVLPAVALYGFIHWANYDMAVSYEILIAAYYLLLAAGLAGNSVVLVTMGIIACLLSRYTMVFWVPLFVVLLWMRKPGKVNSSVWLSVIISALALYVIPFYLREPSILKDGLKYHNFCYVNEWSGFGHPEQSTAFDKGLNFSWFTREALPGDMGHRVKIARAIQGILMLALLATGIALYRRWRDKISYMDFALGALYAFLLVFFMSSPFTFLYYYLPFCMVSAVVCGRMMVVMQQRQKTA